MTVGSFKARFNTPCNVCGANISPGDQAYFIKGEKGYWCEECDSKRAKPEAATTTPEAARQSSIAKADEENMNSDRQMRDVVALLVTAVDQLRQAIVDMRLHLQQKGG